MPALVDPLVNTSRYSDTNPLHPPYLSSSMQMVNECLG